MKASRLQVSSVSSPFAPLPVLVNHVGHLLESGLDVVDEYKHTLCDNTWRYVLGDVRALGLVLAASFSFANPFVQACEVEPGC